MYVVIVWWSSRHLAGCTLGKCPWILPQRRLHKCNQRLCKARPTLHMGHNAGKPDLLVPFWLKLKCWKRQAVPFAHHYSSDHLQSIRGRYGKSKFSRVASVGASLLTQWLLQLALRHRSFWHSFVYCQHSVAKHSCKRAYMTGAQLSKIVSYECDGYQSTTADRGVRGPAPRWSNKRATIYSGS